ncbi:hypothetical protein [Fusibacillus kribbianus]|uniref:Uncharacterized protein n=1 Tax=Fusibacillus kribbianus TaxID=3044208 RepID=A0AAP4EYB7_9FIRM|nr:hypothetical protein [Ruminococcus sp. YH-rum2234]MDI9242742.1 hypothetical protein [Ruminococcus sp. YH-rum2234]
MGQYTEYLNTQAETLSPIDDDYEEKLLLTASQFRDFGEALTDFMVSHGYDGDPENIPEKAKYLQSLYKKSQIDDIPRDFKKWFMRGMKIKRETVFP